MKTILNLTKTTPNTARYDAPDKKNEAGENVCNTIYLNLKAFPDHVPPNEITVTLEVPKVSIT